jgi:DNA (cytosine-5)-methyltransferase 1
MHGIDLFAGPGGWDEGARLLGLSLLGIELDDAACATRIAAGHPTVQADVAALDPFAFAPCSLLIASPPCPTFSAAGGGDGHVVMDILVDCARAILRGQDTREASRQAAWRALVQASDDTPAALKKAERNAAMSILVIEPLRWALALKPDHIALEQVPPVLGLWKFYAHEFAKFGYSTWAGVLSAEQYGVPQTRDRAIMLASRTGSAHPPAPTHQAYVPGEPAAEQYTLEGVLAPWVSMAEALGWGNDIAFVKRERSGDRSEEGFDPAESPAQTLTSKTRSWQLNTGRDWKKGGTREDAQTIPADQPAPTVTGMFNQSQWRLNPGKTESQPNRRERPVDEPAPTVAFGHDAANWQWRLKMPGGEGYGVTRDATEPAQTLSFGKGPNDVKWVPDLKGDDWPERRPATTVAGDSRVFQPGGHHKDGEQSENAIVVTPKEAAVLQSFPPDYPFQGSRTARFRQIGNAIPPLLAYAILKELLDV